MNYLKGFIYFCILLLAIVGMGSSILLGWPISLPNWLSQDWLLQFIIIGGHLLLAGNCIKYCLQSLKSKPFSYKINFQFNFFSLYLMLLGVSALVISYELALNNVDMKGWWPFALLGYSAIAALIAFLYALVVSKFYGYPHTLYVGLLISLFTMIAHTLL